MARWGEFHDEQFKAFAKRMQGAKQACDREIRSMLYSMANEILSKTKQKTPFKTHHLERNWFLGRVYRQSGGYVIEIVNNVHYASFVEEGHRIVSRGRTVGWKEEVHMLKLSIEEVQKTTPEDIRRRLAVLINNLVGG